ncbi:MAG: phage tail tube protein [Dehalococcoidia bacterium]|nr:phage tail tube protein [Dehalococcoidia bacterium]
MPIIYPGRKTILKVGDGGNPETFTRIARVTDISGPTISAETADVTNRDSQGWSDVVATTRTAGEVSFDIIWDPAEPTHQVLLNLVDTGALRNFKVVFADESTAWQLAGYVTSFEINSALDDAMRASVTIAVTGRPVFNATP